MPTFLDSGNDWLNDTIAPKKRVNRNNIKTFSEDQFPNVGTTTDNLGAFDALYSRLSALLNSLTQLANLLYVTFDAPNPSLTGKYNSAPLFADLNKTALELKNYVGKLTSLNNFEPSQVEQIKDILDRIAVQDDAVGVSVVEGKPNIQQVGQPLYERASQLYHLALNRLTAFVNSYSQVAPIGDYPTTTTSAVREVVGFGRMRGGRRTAFTTDEVNAQRQMFNQMVSKLNGGAIIPAFSQTPSGSVFGSDGYVINKVAYSDPRRFY
jgi:hypothetical protein